MPSKIGKKLEERGIGQQKEHREPLWKGPEEDGITFSLLSRFLVCRERFRLLVVEGLKTADGFNHRIEYGNLWHVCEEALASERSHFGEVVGTTLWEDNLKTYCQTLCKRYPMQQEQVSHWYNVCKIQFPLYVEYWSKQPDVQQCTPLLQEESFSVPYRLPSGRVVRLRGKWDSVDLIGKGKEQGIYLQENKTKGDVNERQLQRQLAFDLQTMMYLVALSYYPCSNYGSEVPIKGVRYNVVRRPLSGGKGTIVQHKPSKSNPSGETKEHYYQRVSEVIKEDPGHFFMRWKVEITPADVDKFRQQCLDPILEQLCQWWEYMLAHDAIIDSYSDVWSFNKDGIHSRHPFGVWNILDEGGSSDVDEYLATGSEVGLQRTENLFPELT